jgi:hypothetical protein
MLDLSAFLITQRWPAKHPDRLQLYSLPTPNGVKVSIKLEEIGLPYEVHLVDFNEDDQHTPEFLSLNPNGNIPAILDPNGPGGEPLPLFESGAILQYLAEKTGKLLPVDASRRHVPVKYTLPSITEISFLESFDASHRIVAANLNQYVSVMETVPSWLARSTLRRVTSAFRSYSPLRKRDATNSKAAQFSSRRTRPRLDTGRRPICSPTSSYIRARRSMACRRRALENLRCSEIDHK